MKLVPYNYGELLNRDNYRPTKLQKYLEEFIRSGEKCVKIENFTQKTSTVCATNFCKSIKRYGLNSTIGVKRIKDEVFLYRKDL